MSILYFKIININNLILHSPVSHKEEGGTGIVIEEAEIVDCDGKSFIEL